MFLNDFLCFLGEITNLQNELTEIQEKYFKIMETQQQATASTQGKSLKTDIKFQKIKGFEIINKKIMSDYQKLLEENNKLMLKNEELMNQPSSDSKEDQSVRLSEDEETTEATNTISKEAKAPLKVNFGRTG